MMQLADLPDVLYAQVDTSEVEASIIAMYEGITNTTLFPGDPVRLFLSTLAAVIAQQNAVSDYTSKQNLLRYANGVFLDHLGAFLDVWRLDAYPAKTVLRFSLQEPRAIATAIPPGTRATADGKIFFATDVIALISAGELYVDVNATCLTYGVSGNGLIEGQVNMLVDPTAFIASVSNITETNGGSNVEDDESLRNRIRMRPEGFTTAGSELSYVYWALTAHGNVGDVSVYSPLPGVVNIFVLLKNGIVPEPDSEEIKAVEQVLNGRERRPLTDMVTIHPINSQPVNYDITWFLLESQGTMFNQISAAVAQAVKDYEAWQVERAGRSIIPDKLIQLCLGAGARRVVISNLEFTEIDRTSVVEFLPNPERIIFGGIENG
jgi:phage-related baseplate assembly protein